MLSLLLKLAVVGLASTSVSANLLQKKVADSHGVKRLFSQVDSLSMNELESLVENPNKLFESEQHLLRAPHTALRGIPITSTHRKINLRTKRPAPPKALADGTLAARVRVQDLVASQSDFVSKLQLPFKNKLEERDAAVIEEGDAAVVDAFKRWKEKAK